VQRKIGIAQLDGVLPVIGTVADVADQDILVTAAEHYSVLADGTNLGPARMADSAAKAKRVGAAALAPAKTDRDEPH
jgi:hypothetical protein